MDERLVDRRIQELRRELDALAASIDGGSDRAAAAPPRTRRGSGRSILLAGLLLALAIPGVVFASHQFSDVPTNSAFHNSISNIKIAGITAGCGGTKYCPNDPVTRGQMAAFLNRGLGRASLSIDGAALLTDTFGTVAESSITTPGSGFVLANTAATAYTNDATVCPCEVRIQLNEEDGDGEQSFFTATTVPTFVAAGAVNADLSDTYVFAVQGAGTHSIAVKMAAFDGSFSVDATLTLVWVPFDGNGMAADFSGTTRHQPTQQHH